MRSRCAVVFLLLLSSFVPAGEKAPEGTLRVLLALSFRPFPGLFGTEVSDRTALPSVGKKDLERIRRRIRRGIDLFCREVASRSALEKRTVKRILSRSSLRGVLFTEGAERKGTGIGLLLRIHFPSLPLSGVKAFRAHERGVRGDRTRYPVPLRDRKPGSFPASGAGTIRLLGSPPVAS